MGTIKGAGMVDDASGVNYVPYIGVHGSVGYECHHPDGRVEYLYLNASLDSDDGAPNVFLYQGQAGHPADDNPVHYYDVLGMHGLCQHPGHEPMTTEPPYDDLDRASHVVTITSALATPARPEFMCGGCAARIAEGYVGMGYDVTVTKRD